MKTLTIEEIKEIGPCWLETQDGREKFRRIGSRKERWGALDVLALPEEEVSSEDKLWLVLRKEFLSVRTLHLFACEVAEQALNKVKNPDPRSVEAVRVKRLWIDGKATDEELATAWDAARVAAWSAEVATWDVACAVARFAERVADVATWVVARAEQVQILLRIIEIEKENEI